MVTADDPQQAIQFMLEKVDWQGIFDDRALLTVPPATSSPMDYLLFSEGFESFTVSTPDGFCQTFLADWVTTAPLGLLQQGGPAQLIPHLVQLLMRARDELQAVPNASELVQDINAILGQPPSHTENSLKTEGISHD